MKQDVIAVDTSVLIAAALEEAGFEEFVNRLATSDRAMLSTASLLEAKIVLHSKKGHRDVQELDVFIKKAGIEVCPPSASEVEVAYVAFAFYGKGSGHKAQLNFGDLFSYALAKSRGIPLLYKGEDFAWTDIASAV
jgi:ribonuclease VapC